MNKDIAKKAEIFHNNNPEIYELLLKFSREVKSRGFSRYSINAIFERIRWEVDIATVDGNYFKLSNNHRSWYSRKIMDEYPLEFSGFFRTKGK